MTGTQSATRGHNNAFGDQGGGGDAEKINLPEKKVSGGGNGGSKTNVEGLEGALAFKYGNYGDPFALAPYQLFLLLFDFIFNWTMDLAHEDPLAVLVIFIFQCLAVLVNLVLYMMASASQAMQVGLPRRVTVHHWLNLVTCVSYICLTGWWFIWALRKSWPSVSDQFSFTWPHTTNLSSSENVSRPTPVPLPPPPSSSNSSTSTSSNSDHTVRYSSTGAQGTGSDLVKEHYTLWSAGFNALYVVHRTTAIFYYFVYMRATFLVLNTPTIEKFLENKKILLERFQEAQTAPSYPLQQQQPYLPHTQSAAYHHTSERRMSRRQSKNGSGGLSSGITLGVEEYLSGSGGDSGARKIIKGGGNSKPKRQVLWMDKDNEGNKNVDKTKTISAFQSIVAKEVSQKRGRLRRDKVIEKSESATATETDVHCVAEKEKQSDSDVDVDIQRGYMRAGRVKREEKESD